MPPRNGRDAERFSGLNEGMPRLYTQPFEYDRQGTETRQRGLKKIKPHKSRKEKPIRAVYDGKNNAYQDKAAGESQYDAIQVHFDLLSMLLLRRIFFLYRKNRLIGNGYKKVEGCS